MNEFEIARLTPVTPRDVLPHEERDFTPWLANNLDLLETILSRPLEIVGREVRIGGFEADLQLRFLDQDDHPVLVENQYGTSDHDHLGKLLTYGAGMAATTFIWIAERFRDEHRAALDWLNLNSIQECAFFGIQIGFVRIGASSPAPDLRMICQPNDWTRKIRNLTNSEARPWTLSDYAKQTYFQELIGAVRQHLANEEEWAVNARPRNGWVTLIPTKHTRWWLTFYTQKVGTKAYVGLFCRSRSPEGIACLRRLAGEAERLGFVFSTDEKNGGSSAKLGDRIEADWHEETDRQRQFDWSVSRACEITKLIFVEEQEDCAVTTSTKHVAHTSD